MINHHLGDKTVYIVTDSFLRLIFKVMLKRTAHRLFYTATGQRYSIANYWNDPHHQMGYLEHSSYLPYIDCIIPSNASSLYKSNFAQLDKLVLIGGPDDGVITPWQSRYQVNSLFDLTIWFIPLYSSSQFGIFDQREAIVTMRKRAIYTQDLFGLKTLSMTRKLITYTMSGVSHHQWHHNLTVIDKFIIPHLN